MTQNMIAEAPPDILSKIDPTRILFSALHHHHSFTHPDYLSLVIHPPSARVIEIALESLVPPLDTITIYETWLHQLMRYNASKNVVSWSDFWTYQFIHEANRRVQEKYAGKLARGLVEGLEPPIPPPRFKIHSISRGRPCGILRGGPGGMGRTYVQRRTEENDQHNRCSCYGPLLVEVLDAYEQLASETGREVPEKFKITNMMLPLWLQARKAPK
ncbi:hypothetical protein BCR33DRAFT_714553 [Rhizoclosmatium globosum]|uniref:Uncharacterized protein n=1 Tax=Rhizoclosmatium globosum TaxID=329046 RepID=A0A1Y2CM91_9FUNG|nr:hypothetical protein BCR33DRAFT_714553 [Rhizoclosmatium globosum]|eukprot:ORY48130.1 hypothetical protein BCR33DRAFT_714553 [Rhizoclosmatium globosum]